LGSSVSWAQYGDGADWVHVGTRQRVTTDEAMQVFAKVQDQLAAVTARAEAAEAKVKRGRLFAEEIRRAFYHDNDWFYNDIRDALRDFDAGEVTG
jgi:hypothetical protein